MLDASHYSGLLGGYAAAMAGLILATRTFPQHWSKPAVPKFDHPWRELGYAIIAVFGVVGVGQLYQRGWLIPKVGAWSFVTEAINQVLIFSPMLLLLAVRRQSLETAWLPLRHIGVHMGTGILLAVLAVLVFCLIRGKADSFAAVIGRIIQPGHIDELVQVFMEDLSIAILFVRLAAATGKPRLTAVIVGFLFAAGHIPAMISKGDSTQELFRLLADFGLAAFVLLTLQRTGSILWFVWVHFVMDMMQFRHILD